MRITWKDKENGQNEAEWKKPRCTFFFECWLLDGKGEIRIQLIFSLQTGLQLSLLCTFTYF